MDWKEACLHTRNYGCRLRRFEQNGVAMLSLENRHIKVVMALGKGADIVEFVYKLLDVDYMWHSFNPVQALHTQSVAPKSGNFLDTYAGGWQELFPTYGGPADFCGGEIGIHGEACVYPWDCRVLTDTPERVEVLLSLRTVRSPFLLEKTVRLEEDEAVLHLHQKVTNLGSKAQDFMWGHHPAFGYPFLDDSVRLHVPGTPKVTVPASTIAHHCPFDKETVGMWPNLPGKDGKEIAMDRAYAPEEKLYMEYALSELAGGCYELVNHRLGLGVRMRWDETLFPYLWVWGLYCGIEEYPWFGRSYVMAVEPWSSMPGSYQAARDGNCLLHLEAGETLETDVTAEAFIWADAQ